MNKSILAISVICLAGCASNTSNMPVNNPADKQDVIAKVDHNQPDNFDEAGFILADGTRFVWNKTKQAWEWIDTPQHKNEIKRVSTTVRAMIQGAYDYGVQEWNKHNHK